MNEVRMEDNPLDRTVKVSASFGGENEARQIIEGVRERVVKVLVDKYVERFGEEILAELDLEQIKKKTNEKVAVQALRELVK